ncbi:MULTISPECIES: YihY/virulence factor BrkB family protein [unclassified Polaribacter]|uniref:YihY/virulence factor BrkB family protein n=1 Tax=unclassified Polaribacter TaxID=196858 RepID=UPI0011BF6F87|nr:MULTISPECIES: YihY/virulence factor BrkB family protein [unclassified Polaribacter]TXD51197.1 YihY/virulence factor BrkB family protein [Polaribacter sp. IC063]TXD59101.1 YihY/virulence factor BrkB family protein [Polaribacter sp. IC066]
MSKEIEDKLKKIPIVNILVRFGKKIKVPGLGGMSLYDVLEMYINGIIKGALTTRAGGIAYSFFMAIFPFLLFILTLIPFVPFNGAQEGLLSLIADVLPPDTFDAVDSVLLDIIKNQYGGLLSFGFIGSIFLMTNGVNAIFGGFEYSYHIKEVRSAIRSYFIAMLVSIVLVLFLLVTIVLIIFFELIFQDFVSFGWLADNLIWVQLSRSFIFLMMIFTTVSMLYHYGTKEGKHSKFFSAGAIFTTVLSILTFYLFGYYITEFAKYNELYGSIGTLLILMLFIWLNAIILLLGFELNASIYSLRKQNKSDTTA